MARRRAPRWIVGEDLSEASSLLASHVAEVARRAVRARGRFRLVVAGGNTPRELYQMLGDGTVGPLPWSRTWVYWGDERLVPPDRPESNFRMTRESLLDHVGVPPGHVRRMRGELEPPAAATRDYERSLASALAGPGPAFDLVLLGMGPDAHTASLFPNAPELAIRNRGVALVPRSPDPPQVPRLTLTLPALTSSRSICFLVAGDDKAQALVQTFRSLPGGSPRYPSSLVLARAPARTRVYLDRGAAARLPSRALEAGRTR